MFLLLFLLFFNLSLHSWGLLLFCIPSQSSLCLLIIVIPIFSMSWITNSEVSCDAVKNQLFPTSYTWVRFWGRIIIIIIIRASSQKVNVAKWYIWIIFVFPTIIKSPVLNLLGIKNFKQHDDDQQWWFSHSSAFSSSRLFEYQHYSIKLTQSVTIAPQMLLLGRYIISITTINSLNTYMLFLADTQFQEQR